MKLALISFLSLCASTAGFTPSAAFARSAQTQLFSTEPEEESGLDLNLEEMFDMFEAADKEQDFDDALKKVKGDE
eukprot:CAMPEP_0117035266 /NCGR_PEP_ID=MMETSP0472-20121206/25061_1 /TAXON_ID=693140 ORGANISM="Tiarina fusus, Strain LIS" /NCGR_SAMPLE_ID=MMETSP0472 /ASSEMBLY_ACC=CAM_ASM_000603 /LENGTH=74 /DNA_ID=CAMNT_0004744693 /DNA_START=61 /DNA_END=285 /DNA_ORIENTATION=+